MRLNRTSYHHAANAYVAVAGAIYENTSLRTAIKTYLVHEKMRTELDFDGQARALARADPFGSAPSHEVVNWLHEHGFEIRIRP